MPSRISIPSRPVVADTGAVFLGLTPAAAVLILPEDKTRVAALISHNMAGGSSAMWIGGVGVSQGGSDFFVSQTGGIVGALRLTTTDAVYALPVTGSTGAVRCTVSKQPGPGGRTSFASLFTATITDAAPTLLLPADPTRKRFIITHNMAGTPVSAIWVGGSGVSQAGTDIFVSTAGGATGVIMGSNQAVYVLPTTGASGVVRAWVEKYV